MSATAEWSTLLRSAINDRSYAGALGRARQCRCLLTATMLLRARSPDAVYVAANKTTT